MAQINSLLTSCSRQEQADHCTPLLTAGLPKVLHLRSHNDNGLDVLS